MNKLKNTKTLVIAALMAALTCMATMIIQLPTPTFGYIHLGDTFVILCGIILGPVTGGLAAGIGSMMADILSSYAIYAIPTLIIKFVSAFLAGYAYRKLLHFTVGLFKRSKNSSDMSRQAVSFPLVAFLTGSLLSELNVVLGYFVNGIFQTMFLANSYTREMFLAGITYAIPGILPNVVQGSVAIVLASILYPILYKVPEIKKWWA